MSDVIKNASDYNETLFNKELIEKAFSKAASNYDQAAAFQRQVGHRLLDKIDLALIGANTVDTSAVDTSTNKATKKILDVGCGTGYFSQQLQGLGAQVTALDLSNKMLEQTKHRCAESVVCVQGDAENLPFTANQFDIGFSNLALQWCDDLSQPLRQLQRVVKPGGKIYFTTLVDGSLFELIDAWKQVDQYQHVNDFLTEREVKLALAQSGAKTHHLEFLPITINYHKAIELMRDLKGIGATHIPNGRNTGLIRKSALHKLELAYQTFQNSQGLLPATYQVCFGVITND
ncbi:malonyl-ACP O-methyltransferase BioC [Photobacterium damselae]|uniref:malonyl-ACP O-methyltransferase BioC n=1 Tax=Photobacterium damselae TaxID=38293 RepID=UPI004068FA09